MFKELTNFSYKRDKKEALGFYLAYLLLIIVLSALAGGIATLITNNYSFDFGFRVGNLTAVVIVIYLYYLLLRKKALVVTFFHLILAVVSGLLAYYGGGLLGLIPIAYLTTRENNN